MHKPWRAPEKTRPAVVLLTANWTTDRLQALRGTADALHTIGVKRIVLIGQVATWQSSLPKLYWLFWREHHETMPARTLFGSTHCRSSTIKENRDPRTYDLGLPDADRPGTRQYRHVRRFPPYPAGAEAVMGRIAPRVFND